MKKVVIIFVCLFLFFIIMCLELRLLITIRNLILWLYSESNDINKQIKWDIPFPVFFSIGLISNILIWTNIFNYKSKTGKHRKLLIFFALISLIVFIFICYLYLIGIDLNNLIKVGVISLNYILGIYEKLILIIGEFFGGIYNSFKSIIIEITNNMKNWISKVTDYIIKSSKSTNNPKILNQKVSFARFHPLLKYFVIIGNAIKQNYYNMLKTSPIIRYPVLGVLPITGTGNIQGNTESSSANPIQPVINTINQLNVNDTTTNPYNPKTPDIFESNLNSIINPSVETLARNTYKEFMGDGRKLFLQLPDDSVLKVLTEFNPRHLVDPNSLTERILIFQTWKKFNEETNWSSPGFKQFFRIEIGHIFWSKVSTLNIQIIADSMKNLGNDIVEEINYNQGDDLPVDGIAYCRYDDNGILSRKILIIKNNDLRVCFEKFYGLTIKYGSCIDGNMNFKSIMLQITNETLPGNMERTSHIKEVGIARFRLKSNIDKLQPGFQIWRRPPPIVELINAFDLHAKALKEDMTYIGKIYNLDVD